MLHSQKIIYLQATGQIMNQTLENLRVCLRVQRYAFLFQKFKASVLPKSVKGWQNNKLNLIHAFCRLQTTSRISGLHRARTMITISTIKILIVIRQIHSLSQTFSNTILYGVLVGPMMCLGLSWHLYFIQSLQDNLFEF